MKFSKGACHAYLQTPRCTRNIDRAPVCGLMRGSDQRGRPAQTLLARQMELLSLLRQRNASAKQIGLASLTQMPEECNSQTLVDGDIPDADRGLQRADSLRSLRAVIKRLVSEDFAEKRTVSLNGCILSLTEARLCALHVLPST
jgi:hypothetical protein